MVMKRMNQNITWFACRATILYLSLILFIDLRTDACSCMYEHPQQHACNADFVIVATVQGKYVVMNDTFHDVYKIRIRALYKATPEAKEVLRYGRILTPKDESMCGVTLNMNGTYLIAGRLIPKGTIETDICHQPLPKDFQIRENRHQAYLQRYIQRYGCTCGLSQRSRRKLIRRGRYPIEINEPSRCTIIKKGRKQFARSVVKTVAPIVQICHFAKEWRDVTPRQRKGFRQLYYHGCDCDMMNIYRPRGPVPPGCVFSFETDCINSHGICLPDADGECKWTQNHAQKTCEKNYNQ